MKTSDAKLIDTIELQAAAGQNVAKLLDELIERGHDCEPLLLSMIRDRNLDEANRSYAAYLCWHCPSHEVVRELRTIMHDSSEPRWVRSRALDALSIHGDDLLHVDLVALIADPAQPVWLRGEAADKIGGMNLSTRLAPLLIHLLADPDTAPEILFWCLYAASSAPPEPRMLELVSSFLEDHRAIPLQFGSRTHATLAEEAEWALARLNGEHVDPAWEKP